MIFSNVRFIFNFEKLFSFRMDLWFFDIHSQRVMMLGYSRDSRYASY